HAVHSRDRANQPFARVAANSAHPAALIDSDRISTTRPLQRASNAPDRGLQSAIEGTRKGSVLLCGRAESFPEGQVDFENVHELLAEKAAHRGPRFILKDALDVLPDCCLVSLGVLRPLGRHA